MAERGGFEPPVGYKPTHAFQACALNHSAISPPLHYFAGTPATCAILFGAPGVARVTNGQVLVRVGPCATFVHGPDVLRCPL